MASRPNVVFILSDQHNAKVLGHKNHPDVQTPHLDRLAREGVRFDNAISQNPICTPSRVSWFSGQYCHNHGYYGLSGPNPQGLPGLPGHFRRAGYRTAAIGKIHCPAHWMEDQTDCFHETAGCSIGGRSPAYARHLQERGLTDLEDHGALNEFGPRGRQTCEGRPSKVSFADSQEGWGAEEAIRFMGRAADEGHPFFVHLSLPKPHQCYAPAREFWDLYEGRDLTLPPNCEYDMSLKAPNLRKTAAHWRAGNWTLFEPRTFEAGRMRKLQGYLGNVSHVDHAVGRVLDYLAESGLQDDTIVIYSSDHGDYACEHGIMEKAPGICSDAITRIPWVWRWPGRLPAGRIAPEVVETVDLSATLPGLCGIEEFPTTDGCDISGLLRGEGGEVRTIGVTELPWSRSVRNGRYRLVHYPPEMFRDEYPDGFGELYDIETDPWEMHNLYFERDHRERVFEMQRLLLGWLIQTTRPVTAHAAPQLQGRDVVQRYHHGVLPDGKRDSRSLGEVAGGNYL